MSAAPNNATPANSLTRREKVDPATLDLHDDRYDERPPPRTFSEEAPELDADLFFDKALIGPFFNTGSLNDVAQKLRAVAQQFRTGRVLHETAADDIRITLQAASLLVDRNNRHHEAVFGEMAPIPQHFVHHFSRARRIDQHAARRSFTGDRAARAFETQNVAVFHQHHLDRRSDAGRDTLGDTGMLRQLPVFPVNRHEVP